jgi:hypothetical protein
VVGLSTSLLGTVNVHGSALHMRGPGSPSYFSIVDEDRQFLSYIPRSHHVHAIPEHSLDVPYRLEPFDTTVSLIEILAANEIRIRCTAGTFRVYG